MKLSHTTKNSVRVLALALALGFVVAAYADGPQCLSDLSNPNAKTKADKKAAAAVKADADAKIALIEKLINGKLLDGQWNNQQSLISSNGDKADYRQFVFSAGADGKLVATVKHLDKSSMNKMIISAGYAPAGTDTIIGGDLVLAPLRDGLQGMLDNGAIQFEASVCPGGGAVDLATATSLDVELKGVPSTAAVPSNTDGYLGNMNVTLSTSGKGVHIEGQIIHGSDAPTTIPGEYTQDAVVAQ